MTERVTTCGTISDMRSSQAPIATVHPMYAGDDIVADTDQGDILLYVALNDETGDAVCADLTEDGAKRTCEALGFSPVPCTDVYEQPRGERWRRRQ